MTDVGLEIRTHGRIDHDVELSPDSWTLSTLHRDLFAETTIQAALLKAIADIAGGGDAIALRETLEEIGVDALGGLYADRIVEHARGDLEATPKLLEYTQALGSGHSPIGPGFTSGVEDIRRGALPLLEATDVTPTVAIVIDRSFADPDTTRADQRTAVLSFIRDLSRACQVSIITESQIERTFLWRNHRSELPPSVSDQCNPRREDTLAADEINQAVEDALDAFDLDSTPVRYVRALAEDRAQTLTYTDFEREFRASRSAVKYQVSTNLVPHDLGERVDHHGEAAITLTHIGEEFIATLDRQHGQQRTFEECVRNDRHSSLHNRMNTRTRCPPQPGRLYRTTWLGPAEQAAAVGCGEPGTVTAVKGELPAPGNGDNDADRPVGYDAEKDVAVVAPRASTPQQYMVSTATALASRRFLETTLPVDRLEGIADTLDDATDGAPKTLRMYRQIGALDDEVFTDWSKLHDELVAWGERLEQLTHDLRHGDPDDPGELCSKILKQAHGLAGSIVHLLDVAGVSLVRELRVPGELDTESKLRPLAKSIAISAAIQSRYGSFAAYRQLFDVPDLEQPLLSPGVDAGAPSGSLIGSFVIRGPDVHRLMEIAKRYLANPRELLDEPPEFNISIDVRDEPPREAYRNTAARVAYHKSLRTTPDAVSVLQTFAATPHAAARALHALKPEDRTRKIRPDELRYALGTLNPSALLGPLPASAGKIAKTLFTASERLTRGEVAERADVSPKTVDRYREPLEELGLLDVSEEGHRLSVSFRIGEERRSPSCRRVSVKRGRSTSSTRYSRPASRTIDTAISTIRSGA